MDRKRGLAAAMIGCILAWTAAPCLAQTYDPQYYFPLVGNSDWRMDSGNSLSVAGTRSVGGKTGTILRWSDGTEYVYYYDGNNLFMLQLVIQDPDYGTLVGTFSAPLLLVTKADQPGASHHVNTGVSVSAGGSKISGVADSVCTFSAFHNTWTVPAGTFTNVVEIRFRLTIDTAEGSFYEDLRLFACEGVGWIEDIDQYEGTTQKLTSGHIAGQVISPVRIQTLSPNGRELWLKGTTHPIRWQSNLFFIGSAVKIYLFKDDIYLMSIYASTPNDGSQDWTVPDNLDNSGSYSIAVMAFRDKEIRDYSDSHFGISNRSGVEGASWQLYR